MASPTQWTWVWVDSGSWWWTGRPGMVWFMGSQRVGHNWATKLNWTELPMLLLLLLLLSHFRRVRLCATPWTAAHQAPPFLGFSRQEHWSGLPFPSPMYESEKWKWSHSVMSDSSQPHGLQPTRLLHPWDFPGKSTGVGCHHLLWPMLLKSVYSFIDPYINPLPISQSTLHVSIIHPTCVHNPPYVSIFLSTICKIFKCFIKYKCLPAKSNESNIYWMCKVFF